MPPRYPVKALYPDQTEYELITLTEIRSPCVQLCVQHWGELRGVRPYPSYRELNLRPIRTALSRITLIEVLEHGKDYLLRVVGDEVRRSYTAPLSGRLLSEIEVDLPRAALKWREAYRHVVDGGTPLAMCIRPGLDAHEINFSYAEVLCLPFGEVDSGVDHLLTVGAHVLEALE